MLYMEKLEKLQELRGVKEDLAEAKRTAQNASKKLEEHQGRYDKITAELGRAQQQLKDLKKQHHKSREQVEQLKAGNRKSNVVDAGQADLRRAQAPGRRAGRRTEGDSWEAG